MSTRPTIRKSGDAPHPAAPHDGQSLQHATPTHVSRKDGRTLKRMTLYLPVELARHLAVHCAERDVDMSTVVTDAVRKYLPG
jgi:hypothetical protein